MFDEDNRSEGFEAVTDLSPDQLEALEKRRQSVAGVDAVRRLPERPAVKMVGAERGRLGRGQHGSR